MRRFWLRLSLEERTAVYEYCNGDSNLKIWQNIKPYLCQSLFKSGTEQSLLHPFINKNGFTCQHQIGARNLYAASDGLIPPIRYIAIEGGRLRSYFFVDDANRFRSIKHASAYLTHLADEPRNCRPDAFTAVFSDRETLSVRFHART